jgi:hypothetical protein
VTEAEQVPSVGVRQIARDDRLGFCGGVGIRVTLDDSLRRRQCVVTAAADTVEGAGYARW